MSTMISLSTLTSCFPDMVVKGMRGTTGAGGMNPFIYASWLQKSIRRGLFQDAMYAAAGLYAFGIQDKGKPLLTFLHNRLIVIAIEDIGLANPFLVDDVIIKIGHYEDKKPSLEAFYTLVGIIKVLCESPKTRLCSWLKNAGAHEAPTCTLGPYAHIQYIFKISPETLQARKVGRDFSMLSYWVHDKKNLARSEWIFGMILLLIRPKQYVHTKICQHDCEGDIQNWKAGNGLVLAGEFKDIVMDVHTGKRKRSDPDALYDFAIRGAHIENELVIDPSHVALKAFYNECKRVGKSGVYPPPPPPPEPVRRSLTYSTKDCNLFTPYDSLIGFKKPTFFAKLVKTGADTFVKFFKPGEAAFAESCHLYRGQLGIFTVNTTVTRNVLMTYDYLAMAPSPERKAAVARHLNKLENDNKFCVDVLLADRVHGGVTLCEAIKIKRPIDMLALLKVLLFRRFVESTDTNTLNIVISMKGEPLSVDENKPTDAQRQRWATLPNPDTVFTAQTNGLIPNEYLVKLKAFAVEHEPEIMDFLKHMGDTVFAIHRNFGWLHRVLVSKNYM